MNSFLRQELNDTCATRSFQTMLLIIVLFKRKRNTSLICFTKETELITHPFYFGSRAFEGLLTRLTQISASNINYRHMKRF